MEVSKFVCWLECSRGGLQVCLSITDRHVGRGLYVRVEVSEVVCGGLGIRTESDGHSLGLGSLAGSSVALKNGHSPGLGSLAGGSDGHSPGLGSLAGGSEGQPYKTYVIFVLNMFDRMCNV